MGPVAAMLTALALVADAAAPPALDDPEATLVEEVVVTARLPGPAWWRVSDSDSTVYLLGVPEGPLPPGVVWNRSVLERRLAGAKVLIQQPAMSVGLGAVPGLLRVRSQFRSATPLEDRLPAVLRARFVAARERIGQPASRYAGWDAIVAGARLVEDGRARQTWTEPSVEVGQLARRMKVRRVRATYDGLPLLKEAAALPDAIQHQCLESALDESQENAKRDRIDAARAWASGDVAGALSAPRSFSRCLLLMNGGSEVWRRATRDQAASIADSLGTPGHAVAIVSIRRLLAEDGVLQQLRARGLSVTGPAHPHT